MILSNKNVYEICADSRHGTIHQKDRTAYLGEQKAIVGQSVVDNNGRTWTARQKQDEDGLLWVEVDPPVQGSLF